METLGSRIKAIRKAKKLTQVNVAKAVGVSSVSVVQWEQDANRPGGNNLIALAKTLDCEADWLLNGNGDNAPHVMIAGAHIPIGIPIDKSLFQDKGKKTNFIELDFYDVEVSAGHGALVIQEEKNDSIVFSSKFINKELGLNPNNIFLMPVRGDSMIPTLKNKAMIMVNKIEEFAGDGIYVFRFDGQLMVKRLQFTKHGLNVVSDNKATYPAWELTRTELKTEDFQIIGEVVWSGQRM